jgi:hypothetical protein
MSAPPSRDGSSAARMYRLQANGQSLRAMANAVSTQALVSEAMTRKLLDAAREALAQSYELLEQVGRGRESAAWEAAGILERLQRQEAGRPDLRDLRDDTTGPARDRAS